ncbi:MAG: 2-oxoacid:acceptor oxidoreductase subunit alpha [Alphaproteobacteria bacterium]
MANGTDIQIAICGSAGDGTIAAGDILNQAMANAGYKVIAFDIYPPEIRGFGKCIARTRITSESAYSIKEQSDVLVSLNDRHAISHVEEVREYGTVIYDNAPVATIGEGEHISAHIRPGQLSYGLAVREISERATGAAKSRNMVALGFVAGLYGMPIEAFHAAIGKKFKSKAKAVVTDNLGAFDAGYREGAATFKLDFISLGPPAKAGAKTRVTVMNGNAALVRGCLDAGIDTFFGYPITPATTILEMLAAEMPKRGGRFLQTEDEIAAISGVIGAGFAGARTATATSGPGLALMTEMLGLGIMAEVPCVIFVSQRGGPATGMPTKTEQSDLNHAVLGGAGDTPRIVLAPTNVEGCYRCAGKAFEMAERYQTPVIVLLDLYLSNRLETVVLPAKVPFKASCSKGLSQHEGTAPYRRFAITEDWISPRAIPGEDGGIHTITGLEHDESGRPSDHSDIHTRMSRKRHEKLKAAIRHPGITITKRFGDKGKVDVGVISWGSTFGEALEATLQAREGGVRCATMKVVMPSPLPVEAIMDFIDDCREVVVCELNYEGQFADLLTAAIARPVHRVNNVPGVPISVGKILAEIRRLAAGGKRIAAA